MAMVVKNNMAAVSTLNTLNRNSGALQKSLAKVSSGMKINSAQDDASGYAISERMRVQIRALDQANQNTQNGSSLMKTAEGAVSSTIEILKTLKEKAINAATDTNTDEDRKTIQKELDQFIDQIDDNALVTFNGKYLLEGSKVQSGDATYTAFTNQSLAEDTTGATELTALRNRKDELLEIQTSDRITASYVKDGKTFTTTFLANDAKTLSGIFNKLEKIQDEQIFADSSNESVKKAGGVATEESDGISGSSNGYSYEELKTAKEAADAKVAELEKKFEAAQGAVGRNDSTGWAGTTAPHATTTISDATKVNGAAAALAQAIKDACALKQASNGTNNTYFISDEASDNANDSVDLTTANSTSNDKAYVSVNITASTSAWDGNTVTNNGKDVTALVQTAIDKMDAELAKTTHSTGASSVEDIQTARDKLATALENYKSAVADRDAIAQDLTDAKTLQKALTDNVNAIEYKAAADGLKDDVTAAIRDHLELAANPEVSTAPAKLEAGQYVGVTNTTIANTVTPTLFAPGTEDQSTAQFSEALDTLANDISNKLFTYIEGSVSYSASNNDAVTAMTNFMKTFGSADADDQAPSIATAWGDIDTLAADATSDVAKAAKWNSGVTDLADYGATYDKYLKAKNDAANETVDLRRAMSQFGGGDSAGDSVALLTGSDIGLGTSGQMISTVDGKNGITVTANGAGMAGQIAGITISVADAEGNVKKAANTSLNDFKTTIFASNYSAEDTSLKLHVGGAANQSLSVGLKDMKAEALGLKGPDGSTVQVTTQDAANAAIAVLDNALSKALDQATTIGAIEARLEYTSSNLTTSAENTQAAESAIRDADMAKEMTNYTKNNVLLQAAQSMLAQANQNSSAVLSLLQ